MFTCPLVQNGISPRSTHQFLLAHMILPTSVTASQRDQFITWDEGTVAFIKKWSALLSCQNEMVAIVIPELLVKHIQLYINTCTVFSATEKCKF